MTMQFKGKVCVVTGGASGIGKATVERFAAERALVVIIDIDDESGRGIECELKTNGDSHQPIYISCDVSQEDQVNQGVSEVVRRWGRIDVLINNAAVMTFDPLVKLSEADWDQIMAVNLKGPYLMAKHCLPHMSAGSSIVNVSSVHAAATGIGVAPYAASKGGLEALTRAMALECDAKRIRVNAIRLGSVDTPMLWGNPAVKAGQEKVASLDLGKPDQIAAAILFLAGDESSFITGAVLDVDGGRLAHLGGHSG